LTGWSEENVAKLINKGKIIEMWSEINDLFVLPAVNLPNKSNYARIKITKNKFQCILTMNKAEWEKLKRNIDSTLTKDRLEESP